MKTPSFTAPLLIGLLLAAAGLGRLPAQIPGSVAVNPEDDRFFRSAAVSGQAKVQMGQLAQDRALRPRVRELAAQIAQEQSAITEDLQTLAGRRGLALPANLDGEHQSLVDNLSRLSGEQFDRAYLDAILDAQNTDLAMFEKTFGQTRDPGLKAVLGQMLPTMKRELAGVQGLQKPVPAVR